MLCEIAPLLCEVVTEIVRELPFEHQWNHEDYGFQMMTALSGY